MTWHTSKFCSEEFGDDDAVAIRFLRNSRLGLNLKPKRIEVPWITSLEDIKPDVVILNRGAQFSPTPEWEGQSCSKICERKKSKCFGHISEYPTRWVEGWAGAGEGWGVNGGGDRVGMGLNNSRQTSD